MRVPSDPPGREVHRGAVEHATRSRVPGPTPTRHPWEETGTRNRHRSPGVWSHGTHPVDEDPVGPRVYPRRQSTDPT